MKSISEKIWGHWVKGERGGVWYQYFGDFKFNIGIWLGFRFGISLVLDDEDYFTIAISPIFFTLSLTFTNSFTRWLFTKYFSKPKGARWRTSRREYGFSVSGMGARAFWHYDDSGYSDNCGYCASIWWEHYFGPDSMITDKSEQTTVTRQIEYGNYVVHDAEFKVTLNEYEEFNKLFGIKLKTNKITYRPEVECLNYRFTRAGKGENGWDCDDNYSSCITFGVQDDKLFVDDYIEMFMQSCKDDLRKYGRPHQMKLIEPISDN